MDAQRDFAPFREDMDQLCATLREGGFKASDAMVKAYWDALRDVPYAEFHANVKRIIATANKDTPFPRPNMLRNRTLSAMPSVQSASLERAERENVRTWEAMRERDPIEHAIRWRAARAARELVSLSPDDPGYRELEREQYRWDRLRYAPRAEQEAAVRAYLGGSP